MQSPASRTSVEFGFSVFTSEIIPAILENPPTVGSPSTTKGVYADSGRIPEGVSGSHSYGELSVFCSPEHSA